MHSGTVPFVSRAGIFVPLQIDMRQDIIEGIVEPLDGYLSGYLTEKDVNWSDNGR